MKRLNLPTRLTLLGAIALMPALVLGLVLARDGVGGVAPLPAAAIAGALYAAALGLFGYVVRRWCGDADTSALQARQRELQANLAQRELMLRELHHRVKNNLQMISSLLSLQADRIRSPRIRRIFADAQNRVVSLSLLHKHLYDRSNWTQVDLKAFLDDLVRHLAANHRRIGGAAVDIDVAAPVLDIGPDIAIPVGLIVTEAVSNAMRHAFADVPNPRIAIGVAGAEAGFEVVVDDNGVGIPAEAVPPAEGDGLGFTLLQGLAAQLGGKATVSRRVAGGTRLQVVFPRPAERDTNAAMG